MENKNKLSLRTIIHDSKFLFVVSVLISLSVWVYMGLWSSNDKTITVSHIPVNIELSAEAVENKLQIFSGAEQTASVTVTGNRAAIGSIDSSDITVTAMAAAASTAGEYKLSLSASKTNPTDNFQIISTVNPPTISVYIDTVWESTFQIQENVVYKVADGYYASTVLSQKSVVISGPQTKILKIAKVSAVATIDDTIDKTTECEADIILYDENDKEISTEMLTMDFKTVDASISVLPEKTVNVVPSFINKPEGLKITDKILSIEPSTILIAGPNNILDNTNSVNLEIIDFSVIRNEKSTFPTLGINIPDGCKNISNSTSAKVTLDLSDFTSKSFEVTNFTVVGLSDKYKADVTQKSIVVTVIGPKAEIKNLTAKKITGVIDTSAYEGTTGSVQMPLSFKFNGAGSCWSYGSYKANLTIAEK
ncbi:MAG: hypothetical protein U0L20_07060 [Ruminococcus sp.]|nr:hypothetical protein [Ruminococcus sp.]